MDLLRVDMTSGNITREPLPQELIPIGGRALISHILLNEVDPAIHPLGRSNKLIIAPGFFSGTAVPNSGRLSIGAKSPLTGKIKESNGGGLIGGRLARMGIQGLIIEGKSADGLKTLVITDEEIKLDNAADLAGLKTYDTSDKLREKYGDVCIACIGPCGEFTMAGASVALSDMNGNPTRHCGRGGMGAVMGSKGLKSIVVDNKAGSTRKGVDKKGFAEAVKIAFREVMDNPRRNFFKTLGTAGLIEVANDRGSLPTQNFHAGAFEDFKMIGAERLQHVTAERKGTMGHLCMPGCIVHCSNVYYGPDGKYLTSALEYETLCLLGSNLLIGDLDVIAALDRKCDDYGIDTIETGATLGVLTETGLFDFGDGQRALELVDEIGKGTVLGRVLGQGVTVTAQVFGINRIPAVKGQGLPAHEARAMKGMGVTFATSPQGADHTAGIVSVECLAKEGQVELSRNAQVNTMIVDSAGLCNFAMLGGKNELLATLVSTLYGIDYTEKDILELSHQAFKRELEFNRMTQKDGLPEFLLNEPFAAE